MNGVMRPSVSPGSSQRLTSVTWTPRVILASAAGAAGPPASQLPFGLSINGALRGGVQWIVDPPRARDDVFGFGALDVVAIARPTPNVMFLIDVEGLVGPGPDQSLGTLSRLNAESERLE